MNAPLPPDALRAWPDERRGMAPVVLDLDGSVGPLPGEARLPLQDWQETMRFGCTLRQMARFRERLDAALPPAPSGTVLTGSGDFHHLSWPLIERAVAARSPADPLRVLVFDNHPDNMRYPFGVHCGSWVRRVAALPGVDRVDVVGISSGDIGWRHAWENQLAPLRAGKLRYWSVGVDVGWARWLGLSPAFRDHADPDALVDALRADLASTAGQAVYLSIDKDVFAPDVVRTNWDQGRLLERHLHAVIDTLHGRIVGSDITGDVSAYRYRSAFKRWLSGVDGQDTEIDAAELQAWHRDQHALNTRLVTRIDAARA